MCRQASQCAARPVNAPRRPSILALFARPLGRPLGGTGVEWIGIAETADAMHRRLALLDGDKAAIGGPAGVAAIDRAPFLRIGTAGSGR
jgi:hypothetical protein